MLIRGRLFLTPHNFMLDEVRSLLQKALRRKDAVLIQQSSKELLGFGQDQLPWKSLLTFMFEDHCLSDENTLAALHACYKNGSKYDAVELLSKCKTCRIAACLPVVSMGEEYDPDKWDTDPTAVGPLMGLVSKSPGMLNCDLLLARLVKSWKERSERDLISCMKLCSIVFDHEKREITPKGRVYISAVGNFKTKLHVGLLFLAVLFRNETDPKMRKYLYQCFRLAAVSESPVRLILQAPIVQLLYGRNAKQASDLCTGQINWNRIEVLSHMPGYAVDKHTFRGKYGKGTKHLVKEKPENMTEELYEEFHGQRPQKTIDDFFTDGVYICDKAVAVNPYWEKTMARYYKFPKRQQKTLHMTVVYIDDLKKKFPQLFLQNENDPSLITRSVDLVDFFKPPLRKRKASETNFDDMKNPVKNLKADTAMSSNLQIPGINQREFPEEDDVISIGDPLNLGTKSQPTYPLLQLPTGPQKVYSQVNLVEMKVIKGPYNEKKHGLAMFFHKVMKDVLGDVHTLNLKSHRPYIVFPLLTGSHIDSPVSVEITKRDFKDCIGKREVKNAEFVTRESLGIIQLHRLPLRKYSSLPASLWAHYLYRYSLNVGDSGLYNAVTDREMTFLYGIDMEEERGRQPENDILDVLFSKKPTRAICEQILLSLNRQKGELIQILTKEVNYAQIERLTSTYNVHSYSRRRFIERIVQVRSLVASL